MATILLPSLHSVVAAMPFLDAQMPAPPALLPSSRQLLLVFGLSSTIRRRSPFIRQTSDN
jgi:hypothetical protein